MEKTELRPVIHWCGKGMGLFLIIFILSTCYYDNEETLHPTLNTNCDLTGVTFSGTIKPILQSYCLSCHSTAAAAGSGNGIRLESYNDLKGYVTNGKLMGAVNQSAGYSPMPKGGGKLDNCNIQKLKKWIDDGAANN